MRRKLLKTLLATACLGACLMNLTGCAGGSAEEIQLFPRPNLIFVGDPMPYYEDGVFHIFYLEDRRDGKAGYHPWGLYETANFYEYEYKGEAIPYADSVQAQDIAPGTGSVIKDKNGTYHAFYTGHNDNLKPMEAIMHATSTDLLNWTKIPEDTFFAGDEYAKDDFRDPYVFYVEDEGRYWMLVTTRNGYTGVLAKYTSEDLSVWKDEGIFFVNDMGTDSNMECSSLLSYQGKWYLSFSDQWPDSQFHYRVADTMAGPFEIPEQDVIDCNGFYAGRLESDGENLYVFGWNATKRDYTDSQNYSWGGNLVVHQLVQGEGGQLFPVLNTSVKKRMSKELSLSPARMTETIQREKDTFAFQGKDYEIVEFKEPSGSYLFEATIKDFQGGERFGFAFDTDSNGVGNLNILFNMSENTIEFYNTKRIYEKTPQSELEFDLENAEELHVSILIGDQVVSMYVNDQCAFTARVHALQSLQGDVVFGMYAINTGIRCENVKIYQ